MKHNLKEVKLKSGARGLLIEVPGAEVVYFELAFRAGFSYAPRKTAEIPHVLEHTVYGANAEIDDKIEVEAEFEKNGAWNNASTSEYLVSYMAECADFEDERILHLLNTAITTAKFNPDDVASEISTIREELEGRISNHSIYAHDILKEKMTPARSERRALLSLKNITPQAIKDYHRKTHLSGNMAFVIAGSIKNEAKILKQLERETAILPAGKWQGIPKLKLQHLSAPVVSKRDIPQIYYQIRQYAPPLPPADWAALGVIRAVMVGRFKSWIYAEVRRRGLAYGVSGGFGTNPHHTVFTLASYVTPKHAVELFELFRDQIIRAKQSKFTNAEIAEAKQYLIGTIKRSVKTPGGIADWYASNYFIQDHVVDFHGYLKQIESLEPSQLKSVAVQVFQAPLWGMSLVGDANPALAKRLHATFEQIWQKT